jgi:hypothetical protein
MPKAQADIYKCTDEHGNVAYLQTPCPAEVVKETPSVQEVEKSEDTTEPPPEPPSSQPDESLEACKKRFRDQIDAIDAELGASISPEQADAYKERLLVLTRQLRACG